MRLQSVVPTLNFDKINFSLMNFVEENRVQTLWSLNIITGAFFSKFVSKLETGSRTRMMLHYHSDLGNYHVTYLRLFQPYVVRLKKDVQNPISSSPIDYFFRINTVFNAIEKLKPQIIRAPSCIQVPLGKGYVISKRGANHIS